MSIDDPITKCMEIIRKSIKTGLKEETVSFMIYDVEQHLKGMSVGQFARTPSPKYFDVIKSLKIDYERKYGHPYKEKKND